jgi:hypothetical protein
MSVETTELRTLLDKQACGETLTRYCRRGASHEISPFSV